MCTWFSNRSSEKQAHTAQQTSDRRLTVRHAYIWYAHCFEHRYSSNASDCTWLSISFQKLINRWLKWQCTSPSCVAFSIPLGCAWAHVSTVHVILYRMDVVNRIIALTLSSIEWRFMRSYDECVVSIIKYLIIYFTAVRFFASFAQACVYAFVRKYAHGKWGKRIEFECDDDGNSNEKKEQHQKHSQWKAQFNWSDECVPWHCNSGAKRTLCIFKSLQLDFELEASAIDWIYWKFCSQTDEPHRSKPEGRCTKRTHCSHILPISAYLWKLWFYWRRSWHWYMANMFSLIQ